MEKEITLIDSAGNKAVTAVDQYILRFNNGANISLGLNDQWRPEGIVFRAKIKKQAWYLRLNSHKLTLRLYFRSHSTLAQAITA